MEQIYIIMLIALAILAITDLMVGVSNDAVNFLKEQKNSAVAIVLDTIKAQGVPFFEKLEDNHSVKFGTANYQEELDKAITTLEEQVVKGGSHA